MIDAPEPLKPLSWVGSSRRDFRAFPGPVKDDMGYALYLAQIGKRHESAKPLKGFGGAGVLELLEDHAGNTYRAVYTVRFGAAVYVLHAFQKKSRKGRETPKSDMDLVRRRLRTAEEDARLAARKESGP
jgi:phage-related protein